jgi:hypothetical protein
MTAAGVDRMITSDEFCTERAEARLALPGRGFLEQPHILPHGHDLRITMRKVIAVAPMTSPLTGSLHGRTPLAKRSQYTAAAAR